MKRKGLVEADDQDRVFRNVKRLFRGDERVAVAPLDTPSLTILMAAAGYT